MSAIRPNPQQFQDLAQSPEKGPVVMLNLLKFKPHTDDGGSGAAAYRRYGDDAVRMIEETGGKVLWQGRADQILIGDPEADWDTVVLVEYPSRQSFLAMVSRPDYMKSHEHRESGLERTIVVACTPVGVGKAGMSSNGNGKRRRNILFITTDQMRYDSLQCNGGLIARTPVANKLSAEGINYRRAHNQNVVCMPARSSMITGQYVRTHGVFANGVPLPEEAPSIAGHLHDNGYRTALIGKAHFQPALDLQGRWQENRLAREDSTGPYRGFEYMELAMHGPQPFWHYGKWLAENHPAYVSGFYQLFTSKGMNEEGGGDTGAPEVKFNALPREYYHTDWVAERTKRWIDSLDQDDPFFLWMSFPDPHHPWDPPESELHRVNWRDLDLPAGHPGSIEKCEQILAQKPEHWLAYYQGRFRNVEGGPVKFVPKQMTHDQVREVNAMTHIQNELIDEACGAVLKRIEERGLGEDTDVFFTTDHGELQGDFGLMFKGPYHCDSLMRIPMIWRPAPSAGVSPAAVSDVVGQVDLAPTFCEVAGVPVPDWVQGKALPKQTGAGGHERMITEWDSQFPTYGMHLRSIYRDGFTCTVYERSTRDPNGLTADMIPLPNFRMPKTEVFYEGTEGELYKLDDDPHQWNNLWNDPKYAALKKDLIEDMYANMPQERSPLLAVESAA